MICRRFSEALEESARAGGSEHPRGDLARHLAECPACRQYWRELVLLQQAMDVRSKLPVPGDFAAKVIASLREPEPAPGATRTWLGAATPNHWRAVTAWITVVVALLVAFSIRPRLVDQWARPDSPVQENPPVSAVPSPITTESAIAAFPPVRKPMDHEEAPTRAGLGGSYLAMLRDVTAAVTTDENSRQETPLPNTPGAKNSAPPGSESPLELASGRRADFWPVVPVRPALRASTEPLALVGKEIQATVQPLRDSAVGAFGFLFKELPGREDKNSL